MIQATKTIRLLKDYLRKSIDDTSSHFYDHLKSCVNPAAVPAPAALWLFGIGMIGLGFARRKKQSGIPASS